MKVRDGFVSNSSSSSFIINAEEYSEEKVRLFIEKLIEAYSVINTNKNREVNNVDDICSIYESTGAAFDAKIKDYCSYCTNEPSIKYCDYKKVIRVDSVGDNSIPWIISNAIDGIAITRQHWG